MTSSPGCLRLVADRGVWDVAVIGAGPAGAVAARQLALGGARVLLIDRKKFPRRKVCGACLNFLGLETLDSLGLGPRVRALPSVSFRRFKLFHSAGQFELPIAPGIAISRSALDAALVDAAREAGATFQPGTRARVGAVVADGRSLLLSEGGVDFNQPVEVRARVVLAADGLGHPSLAGLPEFQSRPASSSRIGAGCELSANDSHYREGVIHMAVNAAGYVGLVRTEDGGLNVAAALDALYVRARGGLGPAVASLLADARSPLPPSLENADWQGTPLLTRVESQTAATRLFLLGDAAGYVEPFTGEGITWAILAACAVEPFARRAVNGWQPQLALQWAIVLERLLGARHRRCRHIAYALRSPFMMGALTKVLSCMPRLARPFMRAITSQGPEAIPRRFNNMPRECLSLASPASLAQRGPARTRL